MGGSREGDPAVAFIQTEISCEMYVQVPLHWKFSRRPSFILSPQCSLLVLHRQCCTGRPASLLSFIHSFGLSWLAVRQWPELRFPQDPFSIARPSLYASSLHASVPTTDEQRGACPLACSCLLALANGPGQTECL